jgi:DNA-binding transcriptional LysR family regulator
MAAPIGLRHFQYFVAVAEELSFRRAAERLHIAQPPLSRQIHQLEDRLGVALFRRLRSGVALTAAGEAFLPEARDVLVRVDKALNVGRSAPGPQRGLFVVGYTTVFDWSAIPNVFDNFKRRFPGWRIIVKGGHSIGLVRQLRNRTMDAALIGLHTDVPGLTVETIDEAPVVVALAARHRLAKKRKVSFAELNRETLFWFDRRLNPGYHDYCQAIFEKIDFRPKTIPEPPDHHLLLGLIAEGLGVALMSQSLQKVKREGVVFRALKDRHVPSMGIGVAYSADNRTPLLPAFVDLIRRSRRKLCAAAEETKC